MIGRLTTFSYLTDVHPLFRSHKTQDREHDKASKKTGSTVYKGQDECIPTEKQNKLKELKTI